MNISIIAAIGNEREIGIGGKIPWRGQVPEDLKRFKETTSGNVVIMGRKTYESIGKPLPNRLNIILSKNSDFKVPFDSLRAGSLDEALKLVPEGKEAFVIGGSEVYSEALKIANRLHLTFVDIKVPEADTHFPSWNVGDWKVAKVLPCPPQHENSLNSTYVVYERRK